MTFHIITAVRNSERWIERCLSSLLLQKFSNWTCVVVDDASSDSTLEKAAAFARLDPRFTVIPQGRRQASHLVNQCLAISESKAAPEDVVVMLDGDDWLADSDTLSHLAAEYSRTQCWVTYGSFQTWRGDDIPAEVAGCTPYPANVLRSGGVRQDPWRATHLRTFKYWLWTRIDQARSFYLSPGEIVPCCVDLATMFPLLEMARDRALFIPRVMLSYNRLNSEGFMAKPESAELVSRVSTFLRSLPAYQKVTA